MASASNLSSDDPRRIELLRRLNQITHQRSILEKRVPHHCHLNRAAVSERYQQLRSRARPRSHISDDSRGGKSSLLAPPSLEQNGDRLFPRQSRTSKRGSSRGGTNINGLKSISISPKRKRRDPSPGVDKVLPNSFREQRSADPSPPGTHQIPERLEETGTGDHFKNAKPASSSPLAHEVKSSTGNVMSIDLSMIDNVNPDVQVDLTGIQSSTVSSGRAPLATHSVGTRGSARVRTPSVLLSSHPGERVQTFPKNTAAKNKQVAFCLRLVKDILRLKDAFGFSKPIDQLWPIDQLPGYFDIVTKPMDLDTVRQRLESGHFLSTSGDKDVEEVLFDMKAFENDMRLIFENAKTYNRVGDFYYESATRLLERFEARMAQIPSLQQMNTPVLKKSKKRKKGSSTVSEGFKRAKSKKPKGGSSQSFAQKASRIGGVWKNVKPPKPPGAAKSVGGTKVSSKKSKIIKPDDGKRESRRNMSIQEMETRLRALRRQRTVNEAGSPASPNPSGASYLAEAKALYHVPMTYEEKVQLGRNVSKLTPDKLSKIVALATKHANASVEVNHNEEIELDIDSLDNETLRDMEAYVNQSLYKKRKGGTSGGEPNADIFHMLNDQVITEIEKLTAALKKLSKGKSGVLSEGKVGENEKPLYDSDSSSDSDDSEASGSSADESSSDESESSGDEDASLLRRRRERNLAQQQAMQAAGTPLPSPAYQSSGG